MKAKLLPNLKLVDNWREGWKFYSAWGYAILIGLPELFSMLMASGYMETMDMPNSMTWSIRVLGIIGIAVRFIDQTKPVMQPQPAPAPKPRL